MFSIDTINEMLVAVPVLSALVLGVTQAFKPTKVIPRNWNSVFALVLGAVLGLVFVQLTPLGGLIGAIAGLTSVGLWEVATKPRE